MTSVTRLSDYLNNKNVKPAAFYKKTGLSNGYLDKVKELGADKIAIIISFYPDLNPEWLITGNGSMLRADELPAIAATSIPLIPVEAMAGNGGGEVSITEHDIQAQYIVPEFKGADFMIPVKGSSMYPKYNSGDIIACRIIKERTFFQWGRVYVIHDREQGTMVKRLFKGSKDGWLECKSDNPNYPAFEVPLDNITNVALVIGVIRLE